MFNLIDAYSFPLINFIGIKMRVLILLCSLFSVTAFAQPVNINKADANTISNSLLGIGQKKAEEIVKFRTENGPFKAVDELTNVKGIGVKTVEKNRKDILLSKAKI